MTSFAIATSLGQLDMDIVAEAILRVLPFLFTCVALTLLYSVVPFRYVEFRHALVGGLLAGLAFELAKRGFAIYLTRFPTYTLIYGAFATIPIFLLWLYLSWVVVLAGATFTALLPGYRGAAAERYRPPGSDFADALAVLSILARAHDEGPRGAPQSPRAGPSRPALPGRAGAGARRGPGLGGATEKDGWVLARDADAIRLADLYRVFVFDAERCRRRGARSRVIFAGLLTPGAMQMTEIPRAERLIVALDVPTPAEARALVEKIGDAACFYKVGLELFMAGGYFELIDWLAGRGNKVFADLKMFDIPETVARAVANLRGRGVTFATVHGNQSMMQAAAKERAR